MKILKFIFLFIKADFKFKNHQPMYRKFWLNFVGLNLFLNWIFCSLVPAGSIQWFIEDQAFSPSYDLAHPPPPPPPSRQNSCLSYPIFFCVAGDGGVDGVVEEPNRTLWAKHSCKKTKKKLFVSNLSWSLLRIENRRGEWRRRDPRTTASERTVASRNKEKILIKGTNRPDLIRPRVVPVDRP
jgi:hypothetical protein